MVNGDPYGDRVWWVVPTVRCISGSWPTGWVMERFPQFAITKTKEQG